MMNDGNWELNYNPMNNAKGSYLARTSKNTTYNILEICESAKEKTGIVNAEALEYHVIFFSKKC